MMICSSVILIIGHLGSNILEEIGCIREEDCKKYCGKVLLVSCQNKIHQFEHIEKRHTK